MPPSLFIETKQESLPLLFFTLKIFGDFIYCPWESSNRPKELKLITVLLPIVSVIETLLEEARVSQDA